MNLTANQEIERLKELLKGRKEEYAIFWACASDLEYDNEIRWKIKKLELFNQ